MKLRAVYFDLDDTLCATTRFAHTARRNAVQAMIAQGVRASADQVSQELDEVIAEFTSNYEHHFDKLLLRLDPKALEGVNRSLVIAAGVAAYHDTKFRELRVADGALELLADLRRAGLGVGVISHGRTLKQAEKLVRLGIAPLLDHNAVIISDEVGINKPNPKLFQLALRLGGYQAGETMYVGDHPQNDIAPPRSLGMIAVWARAMARSELGHEKPDHTINDFRDLRRILREQYSVAV